MTDSTNFTLRQARNITIDNKDVERIKILNNVVWEKTKGTQITLDGPTSVVKGQNFVLRAYVTDNSNTVINGTVAFSGQGISGTQNVTAKNGVAELQITGSNMEFSTNVDEYTYTATFRQQDKYTESNTTKKISFKKDTPKIEIVGLKDGKNTLYYEWRIGCKLTDIGGAIIKNQPVKIAINNMEYIRTTNNKGIASLTIRLPEGQYTGTFIYAGSNKYNSTSKSYTYNCIRYNNIKIPVTSYNLGTKSDTNQTQRWTRISDTEYQCGTVGAPCNSENGIKINYKPDTLEITFNNNYSSSSFYQAQLTFQTWSILNTCYNPAMGGWFVKTPWNPENDATSIQLDKSGNGIFEMGDGIAELPSKSNEHFGYSSSEPFYQKITWEAKHTESNLESYNVPFSINRNPVVRIKYPKNVGRQEGAIKIRYLSLTLSEVPNQNFDFGD